MALPSEKLAESLETLAVLRELTTTATIQARPQPSFNDQLAIFGGDGAFEA